MASWLASRSVSSRSNPRRLGLLATGIVGDGGWVDILEPIKVRAG